MNKPPPSPATRLTPPDALPTADRSMASPAERNTGGPARCGAHGRQRNAPCAKFPLRGETRCQLHGGAGARANRGKTNTAVLTHGERSKYVAKASLPDIVAQALEAAKQPVDVAKAVAASNLSERRVRRRGLAADGALDLDTALLLDPEDRKDAELMLRAEELNREQHGPSAVTIVMPRTLTADSPCVLVRAAGDRSARLMTADRAPGGVPLLEMPNGSWVPAREEIADPDLGGEWMPVEQPMLTAPSDDDGYEPESE